MATYTYSRFSTDRQSEASIVDQQRAQHEYAKHRGWEITADFVDEGISGGAIGNRPGVLRLLEQVAAGDVVLLADLSRLSRSQDLAPMLERLRFRGVRVLGVLDNFDSDSAHARMQAGLSGLMSDEMRSQIRIRTHLALETRAKVAQPTGGRAYGYDSAGQPCEPEATIVRELFGRYASGESMKTIVADLNVRGIASPGANWKRERRRRDGRWLISALHAILHNDRYIGRVTWNRSTWVKDPDSGKRIRRERPRSEWVTTEGPALIQPEVWKQASARLHERATAYTGGSGGQPRYLLSGILQCAACGARLVVSGSKGAQYYCSSYRQGGSAACAMNLGVRRDVAEIVILQPIRDELLSTEAVDHAITLIRSWHRQDRAADVRPTSSPAMAKVEASIADLEALIAQDSCRADVLGIALDAQRERLATLRRHAWRDTTARGADEELPAERAYRDHAQRMSEILNGKNVAAARAVLRQILGDIPVSPDASRGHLVATLAVDPLPLLKAAGINASNGSGGRI